MEEAERRNQESSCHCNAFPWTVGADVVAVGDTCPDWRRVVIAVVVVVAVVPEVGSESVVVVVGDMDSFYAAKAWVDVGESDHRPVAAFARDGDDDAAAVVASWVDARDWVEKKVADVAVEIRCAASSKSVALAEVTLENDNSSATFARSPFPD